MILLGTLRECVFYGSVNRQQLRQPRHLHYGVSLLRQPRQREGLAFVSAVHEELYQSADSGRIQEQHAAHIQNHVCGRLGPQRLDEIVHGFQAEFAAKACNEVACIRFWQLLEVEVRGFHKKYRLTQNFLSNITKF
jgi:hypothetical protein